MSSVKPDTEIPLVSYLCELANSGNDVKLFLQKKSLKVRRVSYASPPSSPGGSMHGCHSSSSA
jgi:hypothetical protein